MDFIKKMFGMESAPMSHGSEGAHEEHVSAGGETFVCDHCGETRQMGQKKTGDAQGDGKNVCEFC